MHTDGQNKLTKKSKQKFFVFGLKIGFFGQKLKNDAPGPFFDKVDFGDFRKAPAPPCAVQLS